MGFRSRLKKSIKGILKSEKTQSSRSFDSSKRTLPNLPDAEGYIAVAESEKISEGKGSTFRYKDCNVAVFRIKDEIFVIDDACTHEDGPLGEGTVDGLIVTCPYHDWRFDVATGECMTQDNRNVSCYESKEVDGFIWVGKKSRDGTSARGGQHDDGLNTPEIKI